MPAPAGEHRERLIPIVQNPFTLATVLYAVAVRLFGHEVHEWEPETVWMEFHDELGVDMPPVNHDKLMALLTAVGTNQFYQNWPAFMMISHALNNDENPLDSTDPLLPAMMAWAVKEVKLNDDTPGEFGVDVASGTGILLQEDGFTTPPPELAFAKMPERYEGSSTPGDLGKDKTLSTEHHKVMQEYMRDQAATLVRQISALPWHSDETLGRLVQELHAGH